MIWTFITITCLAITVGYMLYKAADNHKSMTLICFGVICISVLIYFQIGHVEYADQPYIALKEKEDSLKKLPEQNLIEKLIATLKTKDSVKGRMLLANIYVRRNNIKDALTHYEKAYKLDKEKTPKVVLTYAEALIIQNNKRVSEKATQLIDTVLGQDPNNIKALFYKGLYYAQIQQKSQAVALWKKMVTHSLDIPYHTMFKQRVFGQIKHFNISPQEIGL